MTWHILGLRWNYGDSASFGGSGARGHISGIGAAVGGSSEDGDCRSGGPCACVGAADESAEDGRACAEDEGWNWRAPGAEVFGAGT